MAYFGHPYGFGPPPVAGVVVKPPPVVIDPPPVVLLEPLPPPPPPLPLPVFTGKRVIITGADKGTGAIISTLKQAHGHKFFLTGESAEALAEVSSSLALEFEVGRRCAKRPSVWGLGAQASRQHNADNDFIFPHTVIRRIEHRIDGSIVVVMLRQVADPSREKEVDRAFASAIKYLGGVDVRTTTLIQPQIHQSVVQVFVSCAAWSGDAQKLHYTNISTFDQ